MRFTPEEVVAIRKLCPDSYVARDVLGEIPRDDPDDSYQPAGDVGSDYRDRLKACASGLRGYLVSMAAELAERPDERPRLSSEAVGILLALRDIYRQFPELSA